MGLFSKGRSRSQSTISVTPQPLPQDTDHDPFFLPGSDHVYLTHSKDGKPALGRKKPNNLLQDFGFDILGQSFGVPSLKDYERQARPPSFISQSSGLITAPATPRPNQETQKSNNGRQTYPYSDTTAAPMVRRRSSNIDSPTPAPAMMVPYSNRYRIPPPPPPLPPSAISWHRYPVANPGVAPVPMSYYGVASRPTHLPSYGVPMSQGAQNQYMATQYPAALGVTVPQSAAIPVMPYHQQFSQTQPVQNPYMQAMPAARPSNMPPPPPPPQWLQSFAMTTKKEELPRQDMNRVSGSRKTTRKIKQAEDASRGSKQAYEKLKSGDDIREHLSKRIRHVHVCAGCGRKRSTRYQKAHPLKRGEMPALSYCYNCLKDAADTDCDGSDRDEVNHAPFKENLKEAIVSCPSSDEGHAFPDSNYPSRRSPRMAKKSSRFGPLSKLFSRRAPRVSFAPSLMSLSSAEESSSRASSPESDLITVHAVRKAPVPQRAYERNNNETIQEGTNTLALPRRKYSSVDSWLVNQSSPLIPAEKKLDRTNDEDKTRTASNDKPALAQRRTRIPRPRPQPTLVDIDNPFSATNGATAVAPMSHPTGIGAPLEPLNHIIPDETHEAAKRANTQGEVNKGTKNSGVSSSKVANPTNASRVARNSHIEASVGNCLKTPAGVASNIVPNENSNNSTDPFGIGFSAPQVPLDYNQEQPVDFRPFPTSKDNAQRQINDDASIAADEHELFPHYDDPSTPTDVPYVYTYPPHVVSDSWSDYHTDIEREAEEMAERDLAFASKLFDSLSSALGGSATSTFPPTSFVSRSNISIVSYYSDSDHSNNDTTTPSIKEAEVQEDVEDDKPVERIEFSSKEEQRNCVESKIPTDPSVAYREHKDGHKVEPSPSQKNNMYKQSEDEQDYGDDVDYSSSPIGSSLIGHTGHSMDELERPTTTANGHHLRRFLWLPSA